MQRLSNEEQNIFEEAIGHCRHKYKLIKLIKENIDIDKFKNNNFEEIILIISKMCKNIDQLGNLSIYDLSSCICRHHNIPIEKIYIIGGGPRNAINKILKIKKTLHKFNKDFKLHYVEIDNVIKRFDEKKYKLSDEMRKSRNGDKWETFLCEWSKTQMK